MRKLIAMAGILALVPLTLMAQEYSTSKADVFTGFSYLRLEKTNQVGWNASIGGNINKNLAFVGDASGYYNSQSQTISGLTSESTSSIHSILVGPRVSESAGRWTPFAQALFGWARLHSSLSSGTAFSSSGSENAFGMALGGGMDYRMTNVASLRIIQVDYFLLRSHAQKPQGARVGGGLVFHLGRK
jgi:opacity protein-like surface antigen